MDLEVILFVSRFSQSSSVAISRCSELGLDGLVQIVYIDNPDVRYQLMNNNKYFSLRYVPTIITNDNGTIKAFVGPKVFHYLREYAQNIYALAAEDEGLGNEMLSHLNQKYSPYQRQPPVQSQHPSQLRARKSQRKRPPPPPLPPPEEEEYEENEEGEEYEEAEVLIPEQPSNAPQLAQQNKINDKGKININVVMAQEEARREQELNSIRQARRNEYAV